jgi:lipoate-protein ligase A
MKQNNETEKIFFIIKKNIRLAKIQQFRMILIAGNFIDPQFNLATEEYLLKESNEDIFMLYTNETSIIVGKHQNTLAEVNLKYVTENNVKILRRISGGGTVYHDEGNLNFSFITTGKEGHLIDFKKYTSPIIEVLGNLGIEAKLEGKNDLRVNGLKISGNAEHVYKNRVLHHGTLLVSANLQKLSVALQPSPGEYTDNAVKSVKSKVTNLNKLTNLAISVEILQQKLIEYFLKTYNCHISGLTLHDIESIEILANKKYNTWEWNFGYSPKYQFRNIFNYNENEVKIFLEVENGIITTAQIPEYSFLSQDLIDKKHDFVEIKNSLLNQLQINNEDARLLAWSFF